MLTDFIVANHEDAQAICDLSRLVLAHESRQLPS